MVYKLKMKDLLIVIFIILGYSIFGQLPPNAEQRAREEFSKKGLNDEDVRNRLKKKGIDINNIDPSNADQMFKAQKALDDVLKEIDAEKVKNSSKTETKDSNSSKSDTLKEENKKVISKKSEEVSKSIKEGSSLEEAVSEELTELDKKKLPPVNIFGQELFRNQSIKLYRQSKDVKAPDTYLLGAGDILSVNIWGDSEESSIYEIGEDGYIKPAGLPRIYLKGVSYGDAKTLMQKKLSNYYRFKDNQFELGINYARTINVSIVGEVYNFGSFNIPAINTAFNALVAAGGPNEIGSLRNIKLIRNGKSQEIDIYKYILDPSIGKDFYLEENDMIYVPVAEKLVTISGGVNKPFLYELKKDENLNFLIKYARGLKANVFKKNLQVIRYANDEETIIDLDWNEYEKNNKDFILNNGDRVIVKEIPSAFDNFINVNGAIDNPGTFAFKKGERLADLVKKLQLKDEALLELSYVQRLNEDGKTISYIPVNIKSAISSPNGKDNLELNQKDIFTIISKSNLVDNSFFIVSGDVRQPDTFTYDFKKTIRVSDALVLANGVSINANNIAFIYREDPSNPKFKKYIKVDINEINKNPNDGKNLYLEPRDELIVYSRNDFFDDAYVTIGGEVRSPKRLVYDPSLTIQDVIQLAKGLNLQASLTKIDLFRLEYGSDKNSKVRVTTLSLDNNYKIIGDNITLMPYDEIYVRKAPEFELPKRVRIRGEVRYPGEYPLLEDNETFSNLIKRAGGLTAEASLESVQFYREYDGKGLIISDFEQAIKKPKSDDDIILVQDDDIVIPVTENLVSIFGYTRAAQLEIGGNSQTKINVPYKGERSAKYYIENYAGGLENNNVYKHITVKDKNGRVRGVNNFLFFKSYPKVKKGSIIYVPQEKTSLVTKEDRKVDWSNVLQSSVAQATSIITLVLLLNRL
jgi:protein involved in polysaccharide export with SLBB domain